MKLDASKTKIMIVSSSRTIHPQSPPSTIDGTVQKQSEDLHILRVTFDSKMTFEKHLRSVSRAASQRLGISRKSWRDGLFGDAFGVLSCPFWSIVLQCGFYQYSLNFVFCLVLILRNILFLHNIREWVPHFMQLSLTYIFALFVENFIWLWIAIKLRQRNK